MIKTESSTNNPLTRL